MSGAGRIAGGRKSGSFSQLPSPSSHTAGTVGIPNHEANLTIQNWQTVHHPASSIFVSAVVRSPTPVAVSVSNVPSAPYVSPDRITGSDTQHRQQDHAENKTSGACCTVTYILTLPAGNSVDICGETLARPEHGYWLTCI